MVLMLLMEEMQREHGNHLTVAVLLLDTHSHVPMGTTTQAVWEAWAEVMFQRHTELKKNTFYPDSFRKPH